MVSIIYQGKHVELGNILSSLTELKDTIAQQYFQEQFIYICIRNKVQLSPDARNELWNFNPTFFLKLSIKYDKQYLLDFRDQHFEHLKDTLKNFEGQLPTVLDVVRCPHNYINRLKTILENYKENTTESRKEAMELITPETIKLLINNHHAPLLACLYNHNNIDWIPVVERLITPETVTQVNNNGWNSLIYCLRYCTNPEWIPVAKRLITPETVTQVNNDGWNPLMVCLRNCTNPKWIPVAKRLITPETVTQVNNKEWNALMFLARYPQDSKWISIAKRLINEETLEQSDTHGFTALMHCAIYRDDHRWIPFAKQLITKRTVKYCSSHFFRDHINGHQDEQWVSALKRLIRQVS